MLTMYFDLIYPDSSQIRPTMSLSPPTFMFFYFFTDSLSTVCTVLSRMWGCPSQHGQPIRYHIPKESQLSLPWQLSTAHCFFGLGAHESLCPPCWNVDQLDLVQAATAAVSSDVQWARCVRKTLLFFCPPQPQALTSSLPPLCSDLWA